MKKYVNKENGKVGVIISENAKCQTCIMQFEDGSTKPYSNGTIKRHWKLIQEESQEEVKTEKVEEPKLVPMSDTEDNLSEKQAKQKAQAVKEEVTPTKTKKANVKSNTSNMTEAVDWVLQYVNTLGDITYTPNGMPKCRTFKVDGHMYCKFTFSSKGMTIAVKRDAVGSGEIRKPDITINHMFNVGFKYTDISEDDKAEIMNILTLAREYHKTKTSKSKKEEN